MKTAAELHEQLKAIEHGDKDATVRALAEVLVQVVTDIHRIADALEVISKRQHERMPVE